MGSALPLYISYGKISPLGKPFLGGMAEWTKAAVLKTAVGVKAHRGFESLSLRLTVLPRGGARVDDWGRLLSGCRVKSSTVGSNPTLPAS